MTVLEVIKRSSDFLARKGVESPRLHVELLLAHVLAMPRLRLYLEFERVLREAELIQLRELVQRRGSREPLQHIVGSTSFCGIEIAVNRHVLVPRPETELLAEHAWQHLNTLGSTPGRGIEPPLALDFGTGSGCLAIALARHAPHSRIIAVDVSIEALDLAKQNAATSGVAGRIEFVLSTGLAPPPRNCPCDLVVSNPPYIPTGDIAALMPEVRDWDPQLALDGGADGLKFYRQLAIEARDVVRSGGRLMLEVGDGQAGPVSDLLRARHWVVEAPVLDYNGRPRLVLAMKPEASS